MKPVKKIKVTDQNKTVLSALWIFVMFNYLYCDILGLMDPGLLKQFLTGNINGISVTSQFLLSASLLMEIPIAMVLISRLTNGRLNQWSNVIAGSIMTLVQLLSLFVGSGPTSYYLFFSMIEIGGTLSMCLVCMEFV